MGFKKHQTPPQYQSYEPQEYRTGSTAPQKSHRGLLALLLVAVIILGGAVSILSIMNIQLFRQLAKDHNETLPFSLFHTEPVGSVNAWEPAQPEKEASLTPEEGILAGNNSGSGLFPDGISQGAQDSRAVHGICGDPLSAFNQHYYQLPQGLCVTKIIPGSCAAAAGLRAGDILLDVNGFTVTNLHSLEEFFSHCEPGTEVTFTLYRNGETVSLSFSLSPTHP